jgi:predicted MPP superfamily phosphohydrolase
MAPLFSWVHLSDIHFGHGTPMQVWDQRAIVLAMRADIAKVAGSSYPRPDALLVTGDIAFSGGSVTRPGPSSLPEYEEARQWLTKLLADLALPPERAFCIPGNHDVQRAVDQADRNVKRLVDALRSGLDRIDGVWAYPDDEVLLRKRQANYLAFAKGFGVQTSDLFWSHTLKAAAGLDVRLIGLNTSLLCADDADSGHLEIGNQQLTNCLITERRPNELVIVLSHHPFDWLRDADGVRQVVRRHAHVHLSGHVHDASSSLVQFGGGQQLIQIVSGASHDIATPGSAPLRYGYSFGSVHAEGGTTSVRVWPRAWSAKQHAFRVDVDTLEDDHTFQEYQLRLDLGRRPDSMAGAEPRRAIADRPSTNSTVHAAVFASRRISNPADRARFLRQYADSIGSEQATEILVASLESTNEIADPLERATELSAVAVAFGRLGDTDRARVVVSSANTVAQSTDDPAIKLEISRSLVASVDNLNLAAAAATRALPAPPAPSQPSKRPGSVALESMPAPAPVDAAERRIRILVSSPSDVSRERAAAGSVVAELNRTIAPELKIVLELIAWETHVYPGAGRAQQLINEQLGDYDIFVGIMGRRFGTPTGRAGSGTEEEFNIALEHGAKTGTPHVLFYFSDEAAPFPDSRQAIDQLAQVQAFRERVQRAALVWRYSSASEFANIFRPHLTQLLYREFAQRAASIEPPPSAAAADTPRQLSDLAKEYDLIRELMPAGTPRTMRMENLVTRLRAIAAEARAWLPHLQASASAGERLAAIAVLQAFPSCSSLSWLLQRFERAPGSEDQIEMPFIVYHAAVALREAANGLRPECSAQVADTLGAAIGKMGKAAKGSDREHVLLAALASLKDASALPGLPST